VAGVFCWRCCWGLFGCRVVGCLVVVNGAGVCVRVTGVLFTTVCWVVVVRTRVVYPWGVVATCRPRLGFVWRGVGCGRISMRMLGVVLGGRIVYGLGLGLGLGRVFLVFLICCSKRMVL
jgi:hypothetical protein